jgi:uncharacterized protein
VHRQGGKWKELTGWSTIEGQWLRRRHFTPEVLAHIAERIRQAELGHTGELVVAVEAVMPAHERNSRLRALEVFGRLNVWDTPLRTGVLLYLALDRHYIEIVADRGIAAPDSLWEDVCRLLQVQLQAGHFVPGVLAAVEAIEDHLRTRCPALPAERANTDDLPNAPVLL